MSLPEIQLATDGDLNYALFKHDDIVSNHVRAGGYETELQVESAKLLAGHSFGIVLDIGANLGSYTVPVAKAHPHLEVLSFEPQRVVYLQLCTNIFLNRLANVMPYQYALSDAEWQEQLELPDYATERNIGAFSVDAAVRAKDYEVQTHGKREAISATLLDRFMLNNVRLIKIDVEGHELEVLRGAHHTLIENNYPPIIFESWTWKFQDKRTELFNYLKDIGYEITELGQNNLAQYKKQG
jgi:FkbM family methyltransferase